MISLAGTLTEDDRHRGWEAALATLLPPHPLELLLAACLTEPTAAAQAWVAFVRAVGDAKAYFEQSEHGLKGLLPFVESRLAANAIDAGKSFHTYARVALVREQLRARIAGEVLAQLLQAVAEHAIGAVLIKGAALSAMVYPQPSMRHIHAIDLLIEPTDWERARVLLPTLGFDAEASGPDARHHQAYRHRTGLPLGLHSRAFYLPYFELPRAALETRLRRVEIQGQPARVFCPEDNLVHVCGHAMYARSRPNLRWACDATLLIRMHADLDWAVVTDTAQAAGTLPALSVQLQWLAQTLCPVPTPWLAEMRRRVGLITAANQEAICAALLHTTQSRRQTLRAFAGDWQAQMRFIRFSLVPSLRYMRWKHNESNAWRLAMRYADRPRRLALRLFSLAAQH